MKKTKYILPVVLALHFLHLAIAAAQNETSRISQNAANQGGNASSDDSGLSPNGRFMVFSSRATNIISEGTNGKNHLYLKDFSDGSIRLISRRIPNRYQVNPFPPMPAEQAAEDSFNPSISMNTPNNFVGVAFESRASNISNLIDTGGSDIFVYARENAKRPEFLERLTFSAPTVAGGLPGKPDGDSVSPSFAISAAPDIAFLAFASDATNLVFGPKETNGVRDVYLITAIIPNKTTDNFLDFDTSFLSTKKISNGLNNSEANGPSNTPKISGSGQSIAFISDATNLVEGIPDGTTNQIYLFEEKTQKITLVSKGLDGLPANAPCSRPSISFNGRYIVFVTEASNILENVNGSDSGVKIIRFDTVSGKYEQVNESSSGVKSNSSLTGTTHAQLSVNGRYVVFVDNSSNLVSPSSLFFGHNIFFKDMDTRLLSLVSKSPSGPASAESFSPSTGSQAFNIDKATLAFTSQADNLISNDTEGQQDVFFQNTVKLGNRELNQITTLEVPADVKGKKNSIAIKMESFSSIKTKAKTARKGQAKAAPKLEYHVEAARDNAKKKQIFKISGKKNELTLAGLKPGNYSVSYKVSVKQNGKKVITTPVSPEVRVSID